MMIVVTSWRGVGTTTTAMLVATTLAERSPAWLIEADPAGGVLAGRMHVGGAQLGGLERVAFPSERAGAVELFDAMAHRAGELRVVTAPADPFRAFACHSPRLPWAHALHELDGPVVVDAGRFRPGTPAWPLLRMADVVVLVLSPEVSTAVGSVEWRRCGGRVSPLDDGLEEPTLRFVVIAAPGGIGFGRDAVEREAGHEWGGWLPWEPAAVDLVHRGASIGDRRLRHSPLVAAVRATTANLPVVVPA